MQETPWWKKTTVYQIYPRSFKDSTGSGTGDLNGIISKLDYLQDLGIETIWFSPFYPSPTYKDYKDHDCGYDISNYRDINPEYGDMATFEKLVAEMHGRGMKIVLDMVMNHTSVDHPWFVESRSSKDNPKRDWYIWRDGQNDGPPNNWQSMVTGPAWEYDEQTGQYYYHEFLVSQPDLNYRNPEVQAEMLDTVRFWLKKGADGFRLDIIHALFEDEEFRDAPFELQLDAVNGDVSFRSNKYQLHHPDTLEFCQKLRAVVDKFEERFLVGEVAGTFDELKAYTGEVKDGRNTGLHQVFAFQALAVPLKASKVRQLMENLEHHFPEPLTPTWVFGNHDQTRRLTKLGGDLDKARLNCALQLTARGVPYIYYGEEIGMQNSRLLAKESKDAVAHHFSWLPQLGHDFLRWRGAAVLINRDECRTPMQWDTSLNAGFSSGEPWLPVDPNFQNRNVETQQQNPDSLLNCYKRFLKVRKETPALHGGDFEFIAVHGAHNVLAYKRSAAINGRRQEVFVFLNMQPKSSRFANPCPDCELLISTRNGRQLSEGLHLELQPWEGLALIRQV